MVENPLLLCRGAQRLWSTRTAFTFFILSLIGVVGDSRAKDVADIAQQMRKARDELLHLPSGFILDYRADVEHDPDNPAFTFIHGADGVLGIKWPHLFCRLEGDIYVTTETAGIRQRVVEPRVREGDYNLETKTGAGRSGGNIQITDYRHARSADCLPLYFQYFQECSQRYYPGIEMKSQLFLPNAFASEVFEVVGREAIAGVNCIVVANGDLDKIWIAPNHSYVVCRRVRRSPATGHLLERLEASDLREIGTGVWFPMHQVQEKFHKETGKLRRTLTLTVTRVVTHGVTSDQLQIMIPEDFTSFEDHITGRYMLNVGATRSDDEAVRDAEVLLSAPIYYARLRGIASLTLLSLCLLIAIGVLYGIRRRQLTA